MCLGRARWGPDWRVLFGAVGQPKTQLRVQKAEARCRLGSVCAAERLWEAESTWGSSPAAAGSEQSLVQVLLSTGLGSWGTGSGLGVGDGESTFRDQQVRAHTDSHVRSLEQIEVGWGGSALRKRSQGRAIGKGSGLPKPSDRQGQWGLSRQAQHSSN